MSSTLQKGQKVYVEGKLQYRTYESKTGEKRYTTDIQVSSFKKIAKEESAAASPQ
jgi:single-stranded DNA-binding protein